VGELTVTRICGVLLLLSGVFGIAIAPIAISLEYPPFIDFGDAATLTRFAATAPVPVLFDLLQVSLPMTALVSALGFYYLLRDQGATVVLGVALYAFGLVFATIQDGIELSLAVYLPAAYVSAEPTLQPALLTLGDFGATAMDVFGRLGSLAFLGLVLINLAFWKRGRKVVAVVGIVAASVILVAATLPAISGSLEFVGVGFPIGFMGLRVWMIASAVLMLRSKSVPRAASAGALALS
jgi:hypothetical protein